MPESQTSTRTHGLRFLISWVFGNAISVPGSLVDLGFLLLVIFLPFKHNKGAIYFAEALLVLGVTIDIHRVGSLKGFYRIAKNSPLSLPIVLFIFTSFASVLFSFDPLYSFKQFTYEVVINIVLYYVILYSLIQGYLNINKCVRFLLCGNIIFVCVYILQLFQWYFFQHHLFMSTAKSHMTFSNIYKLAANLTRWSNLFSYKAISTYSLFFVAFALAYLYSVTAVKKKVLMAFLGVANICLILFSVLKAPVVAIVFSLIWIFFIPLQQKRRLIICFSVIVLAMIVMITSVNSLKKRFFRSESITNIMRGKFDEKGSFGIRIRVYTAYAKYIIKHPFKGIGIGRRNIKKALPSLVKESGLVHGHNTFLNFAVQTGIQGALALVFFIIVKFRYAFKYLRNRTKYDDIRYVWVICYVLWLCMFWVRSSFDDMFRHSFSTFYWTLCAIYTYCIFGSEMWKGSPKRETRRVKGSGHECSKA